MWSPIFLSAFIACTWLATNILAGDVFAHYMVGIVTQTHAQLDIDDAITMGLDAFALNIGDPTQPYVSTTLSYLFDYAKFRGLKLFISMDLNAAKAAGKNLDDYNSLIMQYQNHDAYYREPLSNMAFVSSYGDGGSSKDDFYIWNTIQFGGRLFFVANINEASAGYYTSDPSWWAYWHSAFPGLFGWESAWPVVESRDDGSVAIDNQVMHGTSLGPGTIGHGKSYMIGLSFVQYKDAYSTNLYRRGELNLPRRMENILAMSPRPDYVEIISWNDGPEGHYIGNIWPEQNTDPLPLRYATQEKAPHNGLRPLFTSFIHAYKSSLTSDDMVPATDVPEGAIWYKTLLSTSSCTASSDFYSGKPAGWDAAADQLNYAILVPYGGSGTVIGCNGALQPLQAGLNFGSFAVGTGKQSLKVLDGNGVAVAYADGKYCVSSACPEGFYNYNPQVAAVTATSDGAVCATPGG